MSQQIASEPDQENGGQQPQPPVHKKRTFVQVVHTLMIVRNWLLSMQPEEEQERNSQLGRTVSTSTLYENASHSHSQANDTVTLVEPQSLGCYDRIVRMIKRIALQTIDGTRLPYYLWTTLVTMSCFYNLISIVALASFDDLRATHESAWLITDYVCDGLYLLDMFIQSRKCCMEHGLLVTDLKTLAKNYARSKRFWMDVVAVLPTDVLYVFFPQQSLVRLNRLFKCHRIGDFAERTEMRSNSPNAFRILKLTVVIFVMFHWNACIWFIISKRSGIEETHGCLYGCVFGDVDIWVFSYAKILNPIVPTCNAWHDTDACIYDESNYTRLPQSDIELPRENYSDKLNAFWKNKTETWVYANLTRQYTLSFYWSFMTLTTLGEQPSPISVFEFLWETMDILIGLLVFATIIGNVGSMVSNMNAQKADFDEMLDGVKHYMKYRQVNPDIQRGVISWFGYIWSQGQTIDDDAITSQLPTRLHGELAVHVHLDNLKRVKIFQDCEPGLLYELVLKLRLQVFSPNDYICRKGDVGKEMYIVKRGSLNVVSDDGKIVFVTLGEGSVFGELSILDIPGNKNGNRRTAAIRSVGFSDLYVLSKNDLWEALREYPEARKMLLAKGKELLKKDGLLLDNAPEEEQSGPIETLEQQLDHFGVQLQKLEKDIVLMEKEFQTSSASMKQRVTKLENQYSDNKKQIKRDCLLGILK